ncbi:MAG: polysaccharide deacetylase family protein [Hyphomicrobiales bacterium]|jgi:allantoinase
MTQDFSGYGPNPPDITWPNGARVAVSFVVNVEEGAQLSRSVGDERNECVYEAREEVVGAPDPCMDSHYAYGPRKGYWRIVRALEKHGIAATFSTCGRAAEACPWLIQDAAQRGHEIACHGWRWETHAHMDRETEREVIRRTHATLERIAGIAPIGWHTRSASTPNTRDLLREHGGFLYDSDAYDDDLPVIIDDAKGRYVILPYAFDTNDMRFQPGGGFIHAEDFSRYCLAAYDRLLAEGAPAVLSIGLHLRILGRPARMAALDQILDGINARGGAWIATRRQIAEHWLEVTG